MDVIVIEGGVPLRGRIAISGAKNAALPILAASILASQPVKLGNVPSLHDIDSMMNLLQSLGVKVDITGQASVESGSRDRRIHIDAREISNAKAEYEIVRKMRASILVLGPLLARCGEAVVSLPGGCAIGTRPVDLHIKAMEALGAEIQLQDGYIHAKAPNGLRGVEFMFEKVSVGATENMITAAALAKGVTVIKNAAKEPEIVDLVRFLRNLGAQISGEGTDTIEITGVEALHGGEHQVIGDRIEAGTYAVAAAITGGELELEGIDAGCLQAFLEPMQRMGVEITRTSNGLNVRASTEMHQGIDIETMPYPMFATDLQAQMMALLTLSRGTSHVKETIFENRFMHVPELNRMGARIKVEGNLAIIEGVEFLQPAEVMATDLRASVALVLAALATDGTSRVRRVYHLDRGYENLDAKLSACGARISRCEQ